MGSSCCHAESPCGSAEERSVLLKDDSKVTALTGAKNSADRCEVDERRITPDKVSIKEKDEAVTVEECPEAGETEPNNTQENGPLQEVVLQTSTPSPRKGSNLRENSTRAQDGAMKDHPADGKQTESLQCTLNSLQKDLTTAEWEVVTETNAAPEEETPASARDKILDISSLTVYPANHAEMTATREHITPATTQDNNEEAGSKVDNAVAEQSAEFSHSIEVLSVPNTQLSAVVVPVSSTILVASKEVGRESQRCAVNGSASLCKEASPESHEVSESSSGSESTGLNHSGEERDAANSIREPETTAEADASETSVGSSSKSDQKAEPDLVCATASSKEVTSLEEIRQDDGKDVILKEQEKDGGLVEAEEKDELKEEVEHAPTEARPQAAKDADEMHEVTTKEEQRAGGSPTSVKAGETTEEEDPAEDGLGKSEEDLYRGAEELSASPEDKPGLLPVSETLLKVEDRCSLAPAMDILSYSEREWKGNTAKSALIRKGYKEMSQRFGSLRRVRGDNYCALRATLFQVLTHSTQLPLRLQEENITTLPKQLEAQEGLISQWTFPGECLLGDGTGDAALQLEGYMELLLNKWQAAVDCSSAVERQQLCEQVFQGGEEELGLLEALKLLMLGRAAELHSCMQAGGDVPLFCWLLFARDSSDCPRSFLSNHLSHVGLSAGLEQVEMFLLGYALQCTIQVYRLYKADTEEFVTYYPDDHKDDWPSVCLVTEDDRHYNVPVAEAAGHKELNSS